MLWLVKGKQKIIYEQLQVLVGFTNDLCKENDVENNILLNRELLDLKKDDYTEDDFAEAIIVLNVIILLVFLICLIKWLIKKDDANEIVSFFY